MQNTPFNYLPGTSFLHSLDPRTKLLGVMHFSLLLFREEGLVGMGGFAGLFLLLALGSKLRLGFLLRSLKPLAFFIGFIFCMQLFMSGDKASFSLSSFRPTLEGLKLGSLLSLRFSLLLLYTSLLTATTLPSQITNGIERLLRPLPLKIFGVSSFELASMMNLSIRFLPTFLENATTIREAQLARGLDFKCGFFKGATALALPLLKKSLRSAEEVALAMESRCYQGTYRTSLQELKFQKADWISLFLLGVFAALTFLA